MHAWGQMQILKTNEEKSQNMTALILSLELFMQHLLACFLPYFHLLNKELRQTIRYSFHVMHSILPDWTECEWISKIFGT